MARVGFRVRVRVRVRVGVRVRVRVGVRVRVRVRVGVRVRVRVRFRVKVRVLTGYSHCSGRSHVLFNRAIVSLDDWFPTHHSSEEREPNVGNSISQQITIRLNFVLVPAEKE